MSDQIKKVALGADHGGYQLKRHLTEHLQARGIEVVDFGGFSTESSDYPDFAVPVALAVSRGEADSGILICRYGIGMSVTANKVPGISATLAGDPETAAVARRHNGSNVLVLGGDVTAEDEADAIVDAWLATPLEGGRHARRRGKIRDFERRLVRTDIVWQQDPEVARAIEDEARRQTEKLELIASENSVSPAVLEAMGSVMTNKYAEGYPGRRYYGGCEYVDIVENLAIERAKKLLKAEHANVQPHSGSQANIAAYFALLESGDTILGMKLDHGGHLTHGHPVNFSGRLFNVVAYGVDRETGHIDMEEVRRLAAEHKPKMLVVGASAYPRIIDFAALGEIARETGAAMMVDIAHIAGLIAAELHPNPFPHADLVTSTTHKTLRGPRGGLILSRAEHAKAVDKAVFPGFQGGPLEHVIAAKAVAFKEALTPEFNAYQKRILANAQALAEAMLKRGFDLVSGGTDTHLMLVDLRPRKLTGKVVEAALDRAGITVNKNTIPFDPEKPFVTSGIRIGTPAITTRGMGPDEMDRIAGLIEEVVADVEDEAAHESIRLRVREMCRSFPLYQDPNQTTDE